VSSKIIMATSVTILYFTTQHKNLQNQYQDQSVQDRDLDRLFCLRPVLS